MEIVSTLVGVLMIAWACIWVTQMIVRGIVRKAALRTRSPSGSLRVEPEVKKKDEARNPLLQVWRANDQGATKEKKVSFAV